MVIKLLADANIQRHIARMAARMQGDPWIEFWDYLQLSHVTFPEVGLDPADTDAVVWQRCQDYQVFLSRPTTATTTGRIRWKRRS
jgi:hypothetical protein